MRPPWTGLGDFFSPPGPAAVLKLMTGLTSLGRRNCLREPPWLSRRLDLRWRTRQTDTITRSTKNALPTKIPTIRGPDAETHPL